MDSKNIYISCQYYFNKIRWDRQGGSEWIYIGAEEEFKEKEVVKLINTFFEEDELFFITDRHNSSIIGKNMVVIKVKEFISEFRPAIANKSFNKIIEFDKIGILRKGRRIP